MSNTKTADVDLKTLLADKDWLKIPKVADVVKGKVISIAKNEIRVDIDGYKTGVVRGREIFAEAGEYEGLKPGDEVEATVIEMENELGEVELSFRYAGFGEEGRGVVDGQGGAEKGHAGVEPPREGRGLVAQGRGAVDREGQAGERGAHGRAGGADVPRAQDERAEEGDGRADADVAEDLGAAVAMGVRVDGTHG